MCSLKYILFSASYSPSFGSQLKNKVTNLKRMKCLAFGVGASASSMLHKTLTLTDCVNDKYDHEISLYFSNFCTASPECLQHSHVCVGERERERENT